MTRTLDRETLEASPPSNRLWPVAPLCSTRRISRPPSAARSMTRLPSATSRWPPLVHAAPSDHGARAGGWRGRGSSAPKGEARREQRLLPVLYVDSPAARVPGSRPAAAAARAWPTCTAMSPARNGALSSSCSRQTWSSSLTHRDTRQLPEPPVAAFDEERLGELSGDEEVRPIPRALVEALRQPVNFYGQAARDQSGLAPRGVHHPLAVMAEVHESARLEANPRRRAAKQEVQDVPQPNVLPPLC